MIKDICIPGNLNLKAITVHNYFSPGVQRQYDGGESIDVSRISRIHALLHSDVQYNKLAIF